VDWSGKKRLETPEKKRGKRGKEKSFLGDYSQDHKVSGSRGGIKMEGNLAVSLTKRKKRKKRKSPMRIAFLGRAR